MDLKDFIYEAISSGRNRTKRTAYPENRIGDNAKREIVDFLEDMGFEGVKWDRKWLLSSLSGVAKSMGKDIYGIPIYDTVVAFASKDSDKTYRIDTDLNVKDTTDFMDPSGPLTRWWRDEHGGAMVIGFPSLEKFWDDVEKEFGW